MTYIWCHGTECHKSHTQDRIRGNKGSKVLRTRKIKQSTGSEWYRQGLAYNYFCSQGCLMDFIHTHIQRIVALDPRTEPLETPIHDPKKVTRHSTYNPDYSWTETQIKKIDTSSNVG